MISFFGTTNVSLCEEFAKCMHSEFEMSMMEELNFFLGLQIKQLTKEPSSIKQSILEIFSKGLTWRKPRQ